MKSALAIASEVTFVLTRVQMRRNSAVLIAKMIAVFRKRFYRGTPASAAQHSWPVHPDFVASCETPSAARMMRKRESSSGGKKQATNKERHFFTIDEHHEDGGAAAENGNDGSGRRRRCKCVIM